MNQKHASRVALVTGAASGIGRATALQLARGGARVACADVNLEGTKETVEQIERAGGDAIALACDVTDEAQVRRVVESCVEQLSGLHILCNVAGVAGFARTHEQSSQDWSRYMAINLTGPFLVSREALPHLLAAPGSVIVNVASIAGLKGQAYCAAYCASKAGLVGLTKALAVEYVKQGLRVNCVCPGGVRTPLVENFEIPADADPEFLGRLSLNAQMCEPEEIADAIDFLASDAAKSMTGVALPIDGGVMAS